MRKLICMEDVEGVWKVGWVVMPRNWEGEHIPTTHVCKWRSPAHLASYGSRQLVLSAIDGGGKGGVRVNVMAKFGCA